MGEVAGLEEVEGVGELGVGRHHLGGVVSDGAGLRHLVGGEAEQEEVVGANPLPDLDVGAVERADGERAVEGELHVPGARRLVPGGGDLLGEVGGRVDHLGRGDIEVGDEDHPQDVVDIGVGVDDAGNRVDRLDDELRHVVPRGRLPPEDEGARHRVGDGPVLDGVVAGDDVQHGEVLALVLVDPLHLDVEERTGVQLDAALVGEGGEEALGVSGRPVPGIEEPGVLQVRLEADKALEVDFPSTSQRAVEHPCEGGVGEAEEAAGGDAIGDRQVLVRPQPVVGRHHPLRQELGVETAHTVDRVGRRRRQVGHADPAVAVLTDDRELADHHLVAVGSDPHVVEEPLVDLEDEFQVAGEESLHERDRPRLERLG